MNVDEHKNPMGELALKAKNKEVGFRGPFQGHLKKYSQKQSSASPGEMGLTKKIKERGVGFRGLKRHLAEVQGENFSTCCGTSNVCTFH
ncbi:hypothetical protein [Neolewinella agarilytica]|uniref:Uncharacterized protein n=1 Tax=Neolewinella agarilytica TaxID=478744 RepID=A0A1H9HSV9_9BACT|nr:hypothetical protein [Neolewinella agarilytica]SEQ65348.1 hypothetical protein SAMN05444359_11386 [Neolewinella agarilytica]